MANPDMIPLPKRINVEQVVEHSYRDFHAKGLDYICLKRSPDLTLKLYFLDGDVSKLPEVVHPHDHRYDFDTWVVAGRMQNIWYAQGGIAGQHFELFQYKTPLNGGSGFTHDRGIYLDEMSRQVFEAGDGYHMHHREVHTIGMLENETVLFLAQYKDEIGLDEPTRTYCATHKAPSLSGLYSRFTADQVIARLKRFEERTGYCFVQEGV